MAPRRMNDDEIQEYLDALRHDSRTNLKYAAQFDANTRQRLARYESLYQALQREVPVDLSPGFVNSALVQIEGETATGFSSQLVATLLGVLGFAAGLGATAFFGGFEFYSTVGVGFEGTLHSLAKLVRFFSTLKLDFVALGAGVFILACMSALDHFVVNNRRKISSLFR